VAPQIGTIVLGLWLTLSPAVLGSMGAARDVAFIAGPLAASVGVVALSEVTRSVRWLNLAIGVGLVLSARVVSPRPLVDVNNLISGLLLAGLATQKGQIRRRYGGGWLALWEGRCGEQSEGTVSHA
jgi:hypothetical protein